MSRQLSFIIPLFRKRWMSCFLREQLNHLLVVLVSILACLWFLSVLVASGPYLTLSSLIIICMYFLLRCLLSDMLAAYSAWYYAFSIDLQDAYLHVPTVEHHHYFFDLFRSTNLLSGRFCLLGWPQPLKFSQPSLNTFVPFSIARVPILLSFWMTSWSWFSLSR